MLLSLRKNGLASLFKELTGVSRFKRHVRALKAELNLPKLLHQALSAEIEISPFQGLLLEKD